MKWDKSLYNNNFNYVQKYGQSLFSFLGDVADKDILDLGCGNGKHCNIFLEKGAKVIGLDSSQELLSDAKKNNPKIEFINADAVTYIFKDKFDIVFSNAVLHWVEKDKHPQLLQTIYNNLKTDGLFVCEFGGYNNINSIVSALRQEVEKLGHNTKDFGYFPTAEEYEKLLTEAGFTVEHIQLYDRPTPLYGENGIKDFITMFLGQYLQGIDLITQNNIISNVEHILKPKLYKDNAWVADYVRIQFKAIKKQV